MSYLLGIDVGTTYTAAAICRAEAAGYGTPEMVTLGDHSADVPSVVFLGQDGVPVVGETAERRAVAEPDRVAREFKRRIGDPTPVTLGGRAYAAAELSAVLTRYVVDVAARREGGWPERIAVTHPASWGAHTLELLGRALAEAGVGPVRFLTEPQAAAVCYAAAERVEPGSTIAVYDLGGGTFDAAVLRKDADGQFVLLGRPEGVEFLGGVDFDEAVFEHVRAGAPEAFAGLDESDPAVWTAVAHLRRECREAKEALSADTEVSIPVWLGGSRTAVRLHRGEFEDLISDRIGESVTALQRAVASAGLDPAGPSTVLLVGGSSRIPLVSQLVSEQMGRPVSVDADPKNAIAKGAALGLADRVPAAVSPLAASPGPLPWAAGGSQAAAAYGGPADDLGGYADPAVGYGRPAAESASWSPVGVGEPPTEYVDPAVGSGGYRAAAYSEPGGDRPTAYVDPAGGSGGYRPTAYVDPVGVSGGRPGTAYDQDPPTEVLPVIGGDAYGEHDGGTTVVAPESGHRGRSPALLIGSGAVVAALAVVAAVVFWPNDRSVSNATPELPAVPTTSAVPPPQLPGPVDEDRAQRDRRSGVAPTSQRAPGGGGDVGGPPANRPPENPTETTTETSPGTSESTETNNPSTEGSPVPPPP